MSLGHLKLTAKIFSIRPLSNQARGPFVFVEPMDLHDLPLAVDERPDERVLLVWRLSNLVGYGSILGVSALGGLIWFLVTKKLPIWFVLGLIILVVLWGFSSLVVRKQWENWTFRITPESLEMSHGWIWKHRRVVARDRIQHIDINSGPFDRRFGLVQVIIHTAGTSVGMIPGLRPERAERMRNQLMAGRAIE